MNPAEIETPPPDPKVGRDAGGLQAAKSERRHAAKWNPYHRRVCFHESSVPKDDEHVEASEAVESPPHDPPDESAS